eukprot:TRINITY_DN19297_c0_g1_i1.p1 TRINITY_DN19297_c0_g1~~TRINITY_DN19297_c0_g1_i1.p1  ORF type:complete len:171 (-),score=8.80 TRINITY_DN19297_c0_g1_i1:44-556(-)
MRRATAKRMPKSCHQTHNAPCTLVCKRKSLMHIKVTTSISSTSSTTPRCTRAGPLLSPILSAARVAAEVPRLVAFLARLFLATRLTAETADGVSLGQWVDGDPAKQESKEQAWAHIAALVGLGADPHAPAELARIYDVLLRDYELARLHDQQTWLAGLAGEQPAHYLDRA